MAYIRLVNKHYENGVTVTEQSLSYKCSKTLELLTYFERGFSFRVCRSKGYTVAVLQTLTIIGPGPPLLVHTLAVMAKAAD